MSSLGFHVILRLGDDRVIAPSLAERRRWARELCALAREFDVVAWKLADTHLHILVLGTLERATELVSRSTTSATGPESTRASRVPTRANWKRPSASRHGITRASA